MQLGNSSRTETWKSGGRVERAEAGQLEKGYHACAKSANNKMASAERRRKRTASVPLQQFATVP